MQPLDASPQPNRTRLYLRPGGSRHRETHSKRTLDSSPFIRLRWRPCETVSLGSRKKEFTFLLYTRLGGEP